MKDFSLALYNILLNDALVSSLTGSGERIFPSRLLQGEKRPSVVYHRITETDNYTMTGSSGLLVAQAQVDCWATSSDDSVELANAVYDALSGFSGTVEYGSNSPLDFVVIRGIFFTGGRDLYDETDQMHRMSRDYDIKYAAR